jgi:hemerythrin-like domain-containing protein
MAEQELKGPIKGARFIHRAILNEALEFRDTALSLDIDDENGASVLRGRFAAFERVLKTHEDNEDIALFPALQSKYPFITDAYEFDHHRRGEHASGLEQTLRELGSARGNRRRELVRLLSEQTVEFNAFMVLHIDKEDELLFPAYDEMFSVEEQEQHGQAAQGQIPPDMMAAARIWTFQRIDAEYREGFLRLMIGEMPPSEFRGLAGGLARSVPDSDWQEMLRRIPDLRSRAA